MIPNVLMFILTMIYIFSLLLFIVLWFVMHIYKTKHQIWHIEMQETKLFAIKPTVKPCLRTELRLLERVFEKTLDRFSLKHA